MQIYTRLHWRNAIVESGCSGSKGLTPYTCRCYRCCALGQGTQRRARRTQRGQAICTSVRPASTKYCTSGNETRTQEACASVSMRILSYSYTVILSHVQYDVLSQDRYHSNKETMYSRLVNWKVEFIGY